MMLFAPSDTAAHRFTPEPFVALYDSEDVLLASIKREERRRRKMDLNIGVRGESFFRLFFLAHRGE